MPSDMSLLDGINSLRSVRKFNPDEIPEDKLKVVLECASKAASGSNTQPWEFVVVFGNVSSDEGCV
jgi:nitroreductase